MNQPDPDPPVQEEPCALCGGDKLLPVVGARNRDDLREGFIVEKELP